MRMEASCSLRSGTLELASLPGSFRKKGVPYFGVLIVWILLFWVLYWTILGSLFSEAPT